MYITKQDFLSFSGIDLEQELYDGDQTSKKAERFIIRVEDFCIQQLTQNYDFKRKMIEETKFMDEFKKGIMCQMEYTLSNGYDNVKSLSSEALGYFRSIGFANLRRC